MKKGEGRRAKEKIVNCQLSTVNHKISKLILYIDGAARGNPGPAGIGGIVCDEKGNELTKISQYIGQTTNNVAEYTALIQTLELLDHQLSAISHLPSANCQLDIYSDSELLVRHLNGSYKVKNPRLKLLFGQTKTLLDKYKTVSINHIPRRDNAGADKLANEAINKGVRERNRGNKQSPE